MGLWILEAKVADVPGTTILNNDPFAVTLAKNEGIEIGTLKMGAGKNSHIVLVPQPSDDLNDPLNWSGFRKWGCFFALTFSVVISGVAGPLCAPAQLLIRDAFDITLAQSAQATSGWLVFGLATATLFWGPLMQKFGRRPIFLIAGSLMAIGSFIAAAAQSFPAFLTGRLIIGLGMGPAECLAGAVIADIFHVHERGLPMTIYNLAVINGINISPPLSGVVANRHGFHAPSWIFGGFAAAAVVCQFFLQPETLYMRDTDALLHHAAEGEKAEDEQSETFRQPARAGKNTPRRSYLATLKPWSGIFATKATFFQLVYRPFLLLPTPIVLFGFLVYGTGIAFVVLVAVSSAFLLSFPPYNFGPEQSGFIYFGPFVSCFLAAAVVGGLSDPLVKRMAKKNNGIYEPEFRLPMLALYGLACGFGYLGWGLSAHYGAGWPALVVSFAIANFGLVIGCSVSTGYVVDSYSGSASSALVAVMALKNYLSYSVSYWAPQWIVQYTTLQVFAAIAGIHFGVAIIGIAMYRYGKRARALVARVVKFEDEATAAVGH